MNLERSAGHSLPRGGKVHDGLGATGLVDRNDAGGGGGFPSVLAALDSSTAATPFDPTAALPGPQGSVDVGAPLTAVELDLPDGASLSQDAGWQVDTTALLAHLNQSSQWSPAAGPAVPSPVGAGLAENAALMSGSGLPTDDSNQLGQLVPTGPAVAATLWNGLDPAIGRAELDGQTQLASALPRSTSPRSGGVSVRPQDKALVDVGRGVASTTLTASPSGAANLTDGESLDVAQLLAQRAELEVARPVRNPNGFAQTASDTKTRQTSGAVDVAAQAITRPDATTLTGVLEGVGQRPVRVIGKSTELRGAAISEGQWGPYALVSSRPVEATSATHNAALPTPEMMVAAQLSYWIAGKVQNAELRLDVFGRQPVEVSISMKGGEAQVEFRTDQPEVRQVLEGAVAHLKNLLKEEGLSLAGVFVGSSGQQRQGAHPSPGRPVDPEARQVRVDVAEATASVKTDGGRPVAGRSVDLFV
ncbi:flagellar hook-length control protein FliK [Rhodoferax sp.]|uniref:flagellar hook-length control protein FliK n=1 Tax=Rhodoferax sp. TaxID=50421 RepID=UPI002744E652|nr:flagellar hook-length control protein FliK [Rhodoferax sp.]